MAPRNGFEDFPAPLVNQVGRTQDQRAAVALRVENGRQCNADRGFAGAHLAIDDRGAFALVDEQLCGGVDDFSLRGKQLALETGQHELAAGPGYAVIDRRIGPVEGIQQFIAEFGDEILQGERQPGGFRGEQIVRIGRGGDGGSRFDGSGHGDAPSEWACTAPKGSDMPSGGSEMATRGRHRERLPASRTGAGQKRGEKLPCGSVDGDDSPQRG